MPADINTTSILLPPILTRPTEEDERVSTAATTINESFILLPPPTISVAPKISRASVIDVKHELETLENSTLQQHQWSLRFNDIVLEKRFQSYHEEMSLVSTRKACAWTLFGLCIMQAGAIYGAASNLETLTRMSHARWGIISFSLCVNVFIWLALGLCCFSTRRLQEKIVKGKLQAFLFILGIIVVLIVLAHPVYLNGLKASKNGSSTTSNASATVLTLLSYHQLTKMSLFLLMTLSMISTVWNMQFLPFCALGSFSTVATWIWFLYDNSASYFIEEWHVAILFPFAIGILAKGLYRNEYHVRLKFIRLRHLMLENIKLTQQNQYMKRQLSSQMDSISNTSTNMYSNIYGESSMEGVLRTLSALKRKLHTEAKTTKELDFVIQTLISDQDLFGIEGPSALNGVPSSSSRTGSMTVPNGGIGGMGMGIGIGIELGMVGPDEDMYGWLSLLGRQRRRRTTTCTNPPPMVVKTIRRTDSGFKQTVLKQVDNYLIPSKDLSIELRLYQGKEVWNSRMLLQRAAKSEEFNLLTFSKVCMFPMTATLLTTIESHNLFTELPVSVETAAEFGLEIESRYQTKNPYHNAIHAASVIWDVNFFLRKLEAKELSPLQILSALIAAAIHDVNHPGLSNAYLINTNAPLAIKYSDDSCLERMHLAEGFQACTKEGCDLFEDMNKEMKRQARQIIISMVLATDLSRHMKHVNKLKSKRYGQHAAATPDATIVIEGTAMATQDNSTATGRCLPADLILQSILMMSDLGHANKSFGYHYEWSKLVTEEFHLQGDTEKQFGLEISPLCDRKNTKFEKNQIGFLEFVVLPLYNAVYEVIKFKDFEQVLHRIQKNTITWKERAEKAEQGEPLPAPPPSLGSYHSSNNTSNNSSSNSRTMVDNTGCVTTPSSSFRSMHSTVASEATVVEETAEELKELDHLQIEIYDTTTATTASLDSNIE